jgi:predicted ATPase
VAFLFTDVEASTQGWMTDAAGMSASLAVHDVIVRAAIESSGGFVFSTAGDSFAAAFTRASDAVAAARRAQSALEAAAWPGPALRVRMGLHIGEADERGGDYFGPVVSTAARVAEAGHGGQVLLTDPVRASGGVAAVDLGVHSLRDVPEAMRLFQLGDRRFPPLRVTDPAMTNLPVRPTRLIGRDEDVASVRRLLAEHRLVTVTAVGGSGKTRLALAVGEAELPHRRGGVWFADLTAVTRDDQVHHAVANAVRLSLRDGDPIGQIVEYLADRAALLVLDNCEHVVDGCAQFAERLLTTAGDTVVLATSREVLGVQGEHTILLGALPADGIDSPAVRLFAERAAAADSRFVVDETNADAIAAVCRRLDGLPLAIELAAAQVKMMTIRELEAGLDDRFALLAGGRLRRQRTLQGTLDWSFDLLDDEERRVLLSLGVFVDGFDIDAAAAAAGVPRAAAFATVEALTSKSMVVRTDDGARSRFGLLETVKAYAEGRLVDSHDMVDVRDRHLDHFHAAATAHGCNGISDIRLGVALRRDRGNLTAAFEWAATTGRWNLAAELIAGGYPAYIFDGATLDARRLMQRALRADAGSDPQLAEPLRVALMMTTAWLTDWVTYREAAQDLTRSSSASMRAIGHLALGVATPFADIDTTDHVERARAELAAAEAAAGDPTNEVIGALIAWVEGRVAAGHGDYAGALQGCTTFLATCRALDFYPTPTPRAAKHAAVCQILLGDPAAALDTAAWLADFDASTFDIEDIRALALLAQGRPDDARSAIAAHATRGLSGRMLGQFCDSVLLLAALAHAEGDDDRARHLLLNMGAGLEPGIIIYSRHLAAELGAGGEHAARQRAALTYADDSPEGYNGTRTAATAVRAELTRRGWT